MNITEEELDCWTKQPSPFYQSTFWSQSYKTFPVSNLLIL